MTFTYEYPRPFLTVDLVVFGLGDELEVLLVRRGSSPYEGSWALPGGHVNVNEPLPEAALRECREETKVEPSHLEQLATFGQPGRDPRGWVVSVAYLALLRKDQVNQPSGGDDAAEASWVPLSQVPPLAFDHDQILQTAVARLRSKLRWQPIGLDLLPETFTLPELQNVYETILGHPLDRRNFYKKVLKYGVLEKTNMKTPNQVGRKAQGWKFNRKAYADLLAQGVSFEV